VHDQSEALAFQLLGPVEAVRNGRPVPLGSPQQRAVLALLLLREGRALAMPELIAGMWEGEPPRTARGTVLTYVSRLRALLEPDRGSRQAGRVLLSVPGGYALRAPHATVDATLFAREAADLSGPPQDVHDRLTRALGRWRGGALAGVPGPGAQRHRDHLEELHRQTRQALYDSALKLGRHLESVPELRLLNAEFPFSTQPCALLMLALYRAGRQAEALEEYARTRRLIRAELGVEPDRELVLLQRRILAADPTLAAPATGPEPGPGPGPEPMRARTPVPRRTWAGADSGARPVRAAGVSPYAAGATAHWQDPRPRPQQLPTDAQDFTGREDSVRALVAVLSREEAAAGSVPAPGTAATMCHAVVVCVLTGTAGVGKTALAVHAAHRLAAEFPDGRLYADLGGGGSPVDPASVLADFLAALGTPPDRIPPDLDRRAALFRTVLADRRALVVLDNAHDTEQVRPLLPGTAGSAALVTSRARDLILPGAHRFDVELPTRGEARSLLAAIVGPERVAAEPEAAGRLVEACGRLPLAVRIVASRLAARPGRSLTALAGRLTDERLRLDELRIGNLAVESSFRLGHAALTEDAARAFRLLSLTGATDFPLSAAAALLGTDEHTAEYLAETLVDAGLLESHTRGRYRFHDLLRLYGRRCAERTESAQERGAALLRLLEMLRTQAVRAARTAVPEDVPDTWLPGAGRVGPLLAGTEEAREWFGTEHALLTVTLEQCLLLHEGPAMRGAVELLGLIAVSGYFTGRAHYREVRRVAGLAAERALEHRDGRCRARALHTRAWLAFLTARYEAAETDARTALAIAAQTGDDQRQHMTGGLLAMILRATDRPEEAERAQRTASRFAGDPQQPGSPAAVVGYVARLYTALGSVQRQLPVATGALYPADATGQAWNAKDDLVKPGGSPRG
jgi:DNA-binding SARP family transcriptional activator